MLKNGKFLKILLLKIYKMRFDLMFSYGNFAHNRMKGCGFFMPDLFNLTNDMNEYLHSLPQNVQDEIIKGGAKINSLQDLKQVAEEIMKDER